LSIPIGINGRRLHCLNYRSDCDLAFIAYKIQSRVMKLHD